MPSEAPAAFLTPQWLAPLGVGALMSTRQGGVSAAPFDSLNLGLAVGDDPHAVQENRGRFERAMQARPFWLRQVHGAAVVHATHAGLALPLAEADACWTNEPNLACTVQVADCMPVLFAAPNAKAVAAAHAGWRGLAGGVLQATLAAVCEASGCAASEVAVWLGPCVGPRQFEVGEDVLRAFGADADGAAFTRRPGSAEPRRWLANLELLALQALRQAGATLVHTSGMCTVENRSRFFSFRRDRVTGRMAAAVWLRD